MDGHFVYKRLGIRWNVVDDADADQDGAKGCVLQLRLSGASIHRRYPTRISQIHAEREARAMAPRLLAIAAEWLKGSTVSTCHGSEYRNDTRDD